MAVSPETWKAAALPEGLHPLKRARIELGISQGEIAAATFLGVSTIKRAEEGRPLNADVIIRICEYISEQYRYQVTPEELGLKRRGKCRIVSISDQQETVSTDDIQPLRYQRLLRGWSQQDVVNELGRLLVEDGLPDAGLGLCVETVSRWENGKRKPAIVYRKQLCKLYGMNTLELGIF